MPFEDLARCSFCFRVKLHFGKAAANAGVIAVGLVSIGVKPRKEVVNGERCKEHVDADDSGPVLLDPS